MRVEGRALVRIFKGEALKLSVLLFYHFVLVIKLEVVTVITAFLHKPRHFVLVKINLTDITIILFVIDIICTMLTVGFSVHILFSPFLFFRF